MRSLRIILMQPNGSDATKCTKHTKTSVLGPMGWIGCIRCEKFRCDFMAQTCALIAPVQPVLHQVSCSNETNSKCTQIVRNAPEHEFGSNGVDRVCSLRKISMRLYGTNLSINCTSSTCFAPSFVQ